MTKQPNKKTPEGVPFRAKVGWINGYHHPGQPMASISRWDLYNYLYNTLSEALFAVRGSEQTRKVYVLDAELVDALVERWRDDATEGNKHDTRLLDKTLVLRWAAQDLEALLPARRRRAAK